MNRILYSTVFVWCGTGNAKDLVIETIRTPRLTPSTGIVIHKQTNNFIDIEAPVSRVWVGCSTIDPKMDASFLGIKIEDAEVVYRFGPRRAIHDVPMCLAEEKKYRHMMKGAKTVRVMGTMLSFWENRPVKRYPGDRTPDRFVDKPKILAGFFVRLQAGDKCASYFANDCDLPKNYWAGTTPVE